MSLAELKAALVEASAAYARACTVANSLADSRRYSALERRYATARVAHEAYEAYWAHPDAQSFPQGG